ncbi:MAG: TIGR02147 family protein [Pseudobdellovibrionaceae bacterium]|jgi:uncharacterized protein (TIGR02147 family)
MTAPLLKTIFDYSDYKKYICDRFENSEGKGRGLKLKMAEHLHCQTSFVSQVLNGQPHFSLEQAIKLNSFFLHNKDESQFFILVLQYQRAGSSDLQAYFKEQMRDILKQRSDLKNRLKVKNGLKLVQQQTYYSSWHYAAVHMLVSIDKYQKPEAIEKYLNLPREKTLEILTFLEQAGLIARKNGHYVSGVTRLHLPKDSPLIQRQHSNWRLKAIDAISLNRDQDLHYSTVVSMSPSDVPVVKEILIKAIEECRKVIKESKEESLQSICIDLFEV